MALTADQKRRALELLDRLDRQSAETVLSSEWSFGDWLKSTLYDIYLAIRDSISTVWKWIKGLFY